MTEWKDPEAKAAGVPDLDWHSWRELIGFAMRTHDDSWANVEVVALEEDDSLDTKFDHGWGGLNGCAFTVWTQTRVYFPVSYDGSEWVESASRNPDGVAMNHVGG